LRVSERVYVIDPLDASRLVFRRDYAVTAPCFLVSTAVCAVVVVVTVST
jgi:hypothetical protein